MSRGPGRWQRALLAALDEHPVVPVRDVTLEVTDGAATRPQHVAARDAAHRLHRSGRVRAGYMYLADSGTGRATPHLVVLRPDDTRQLARPMWGAKWSTPPEEWAAQQQRAARRNALVAGGMDHREVTTLLLDDAEAFAEQGDRAIAEQAASAEPEPGR